MRVVITGGTGFIGKAFATTLADRGDDVVVFTRRASGRMAHPKCCARAGNIELVRWTPDAPGDWLRELESADAVVNLAGAGVLAARWSEARRQELRVSRLRPTELIARALAANPRKPRVFISGSAVGYYGTSTGDRVLTEEAAAGRDFLAALARDWETAAEPARAAGIRVCHPRFGVVLGPRGGMLAKMLPAFRAFLGGPVGDGRQYLSWIHVRDAVHALEFFLARSDLEGAFNVTAPEPVTMNELARELAGVLGRPARVRVPALAVKLAFGSGAEVVLSGQRAVPRRLVDAGFAFVFPDVRSALADLV